MERTWRLVVAEGEARIWKPAVLSAFAEQEVLFSDWSEESEVSLLERGQVEPSFQMRQLLALSEQVKGASEGAFDIQWQGGYDLGGVAKGWAVDQVADRLMAEGVTDFLFEFGGEIVARRHSPSGDGWEIGIEKPEPLTGEIAFTIRLRDECIATSGNYQQASHLKDGRTGTTLGGPLRSVSVVMPTCAEADAWATALFVLGAAPSTLLGLVDRNQ